MDSVVLSRPTTSNFGRLEAAMAGVFSAMPVKHDKTMQTPIIRLLLQR
jgi:hypothetical protein